MSRAGPRALLIVASAMLVLAGAARAGSQAPPPERPAPSAPPPLPIKAADTGAGLFQAKCGYCHLPGGTGTTMLTRRLGPGNGLLAERRDLSADYVRAVVRSGIGSMPALTRVEVEDRQLDMIAAWLADGARRNRKRAR